MNPHQPLEFHFRVFVHMEAFAEDAGVVEGAIEAAVGCNRRGDRRARIGGVPDVAADEGPLAARALDRRNCLLPAGIGNVRDYDPCARGGECQRHLLPDA